MPSRTENYYIYQDQVIPVLSLTCTCVKIELSVSIFGKVRLICVNNNSIDLSVDICNLLRSLNAHGMFVR